jgi:hypothetical protein
MPPNTRSVAFSAVTVEMKSIALWVVNPGKSVTLVFTVNAGINAYSERLQALETLIEIGDAECRSQPVLLGSSSLVRVVRSQSEGGTISSEHAEPVIHIRCDHWQAKDFGVPLHCRRPVANLDRHKVQGSESSRHELTIGLLPASQRLLTMTHWNGTVIDRPERHYRQTPHVGAESLWMRQRPS